MKKPIFLTLFLFTLFSVQQLHAQETDVLLDERDGNIYLIIQFNEQMWMAQNLKFDVGDGSLCYDGQETNCMLKGRWYTWQAAQKACPKGYRLPTDDDWKALEKYVGMNEADLDLRYNRNSGTVGKFLKVDGGLGFDAEYAGLVSPVGEDSYYTTHAYFWTASQFDDINGWARVIEKTKQGIDRQVITKTYGLNVRCVKNLDAGEN